MLKEISSLCSFLSKGRVLEAFSVSAGLAHPTPGEGPAGPQARLVWQVRGLQLQVRSCCCF